MRRGTATRRPRDVGWAAASASSRARARSSTPEDVDGDEDRQQRAAGHQAAEHVDRVVRAEVDARGADGADEDRGDDVRDLALPLVVGEARHAEGGEPVQDGGAQGVAGREVGDVVEADVVDVEDRTHECLQVDRLRGGEVLEGPLHREAERAEREQQRKIATAVRQGEEAQHGESRARRTSRCPAR